MLLMLLMCLLCLYSESLLLSNTAIISVIAGAVVVVGVVMAFAVDRRRRLSLDTRGGSDARTERVDGNAKLFGGRNSRASSTSRVAPSFYALDEVVGSSSSSRSGDSDRASGGVLAADFKLTGKENSLSRPCECTTASGTTGASEPLHQLELRRGGPLVLLRRTDSGCIVRPAAQPHRDEVQPPGMIVDW
jgi:hypothetical protein